MKTEPEKKEPMAGLPEFMKEEPGLKKEDPGLMKDKAITESYVGKNFLDPTVNHQEEDWEEEDDDEEWFDGDDLSEIFRAPARQELLEDAILATTQQRNNSYGPPTQDFRRIAGMLNAMGFRFFGDFGADDIQPHHVAMIMMALKLSRLTWDPQNRDSWLDIGGYSACGYECTVS